MPELFVRSSPVLWNFYNVAVHDAAAPVEIVWDEGTFGRQRRIFAVRLAHQRAIHCGFDVKAVPGKANR
ncbi:MAG TPA: hypothetical protein VIF88_15760, partial [Methylocystis sp.]